MTMGFQMVWLLFVADDDTEGVDDDGISSGLAVDDG